MVLHVNKSTIDFTELHRGIRGQNPRNKRHGVRHGGIINNNDDLSDSVRRHQVAGDVDVAV